MDLRKKGYNKMYKISYAEFNTFYKALNSIALFESICYRHSRDTHSDNLFHFIIYLLLYYNIFL